MRKFIGLLAGLVVLAVAGTALAGPPAVDSNGDFVDLSIKITPPTSGTTRAPRGIGVTFDAFTGNRINANNTINTNSLQVRFNQNFTANGLLFPACAINTTGVSTCPANTRIGTGTAEGELLSSTGGPPSFVAATVAEYNGKPLGDKSPTYILVASVGGKPVTELDFRVVPQADGLSLNQIIFPGTGSGPTIYLTKFHLVQPDRSEVKKIHGRKTTIHLLDAPTTCHGSWTFSQTLGFASGPPIVATDSQPCLKG